jgi:hypothetical protein
MSTSSVLEDTLANARALGLHTTLLEPHFDLDTADDLVRLERIRCDGDLGNCARTVALLDEHRLWPGAPDRP